MIGIAADPAGDDRDAWIPTALEELLARRLQRVDTVVVLPTLRLHQARRELTDPTGTAPDWPNVARGLGAHEMVSGRCSGPDNALTLQLMIRRFGEPARADRSVTIPAGRLFEVLDQATRWLLDTLALLPLADDVAGPVFEPPSRSTTAVEYYCEHCHFIWNLPDASPPIAWGRCKLHTRARCWSLCTGIFC